MDERPSITGFVDVGGGIELYFEEAGTGPAVLFIHAHSVDRRMWDAQFNRLSSQYRVVRYDLRGYGLSGMPQEDKDYLHAEDLYKLMDHLDIRSAHMVGLSLGAFVALDFMHLYPEHTLSAAVAAGAIYTDDEEESRIPEDQTAPDPGIASLAPGRGDPIILKRIDEWFTSLMNCSGPHKEVIREPLRRMINDWSAWTFRYREPRCLLGSTLNRGLREASPRPPILVIIGSDDSKGSIHSSEKLLNLVPSALRVDIADAGHFSNMERPDEFTSELERFFKEISIV